MGKPGNTGLKRIILATRYSLQGVASAWRHEAAFRQELIATVVLTPAAFWLGGNALEILMLVMSLLLVLIVELLNSAIEATVDRISAHHHDLAGHLDRDAIGRVGALARRARRQDEPDP